MGAAGAGGQGGSVSDPCVSGSVPDEFAVLLAAEGALDVYDMAVRCDGQVALAVSAVRSGVDFGPPTMPFPEVGETDAYVASFGGEGSSAWAQSLASAYDDVLSGIAFDPQGSVVAVGATNTDDSLSANLSAFDPAGNSQWSRVFAKVKAAGVAIARDGSSVVVGTFQDDSPIDFDGHLIIPDGYGDVFVSYFGADGACSWAVGFPTQSLSVGGAAFDSAGNVVVVGTFAGEIALGGALMPALGFDLFIAKISPSGNVNLAVTVPGPGGDGFVEHDVTAVAVDSVDNILIAGQFRGALDFGTGVVQGAPAVYVAKFDRGASASWVRAYDTPTEALLYDVAVDPFDNVLAAGAFSGTLSPLGLESLGLDAFVFKYSPSGDLTWVKQLHGPSGQSAVAVGSDAAGNVFTAGRFYESIDFGQGPLSATGYASNIFLAKLAP